MLNPNLHPSASAPLRPGRALSCCAGALLLAQAALGALPQTALAEETPLKDEAVYIDADAAGVVEGVYVVNLFQTERAQSVADPAAYRAVKNLSTAEALHIDGGCVRLTTMAGKPFYYEGIMDADTELPWDISLAYRLDGRKTDARQLAGATGHLEVTLEINAKTAPADDGNAPGPSDFAEHYFVQAQGTFPSDRFAITDGENVMVARSGDNTIITALVLPGESHRFTLSGEARDFACDGWQISALPLDLAFDIAEQDTEQLDERAAELSGATGRLSAGAAELDEGARRASLGATALDRGALDVDEAVGAAQRGAVELSDGAEEIAQGAQELASGTRELSEGWSQLARGIEEVEAGAARLAEGSGQMNAGLEAQCEELASAAGSLGACQAAVEEALARGDADGARAAVEQLTQASMAAGAYGALTEAQEGLDRIDAGIAALTEGAQGLSTAQRTFGDGISRTASAAEALAQGTEKLACGAEELAEGSFRLKQGTGALSEGTTALARGCAELQDGTAELACGANELAEGTERIDEEILEQLQKAVDSKMVGDAPLHSFVVPDNDNVSAVQFVYVVEGIEEPDDEPVIVDEPDPSLLDRLLALLPF